MFSQLNAEIDDLIKYTDITINTNTSGHGTPTQSGGGAYFEPLATYTALGIAKNKILNKEKTVTRRLINLGNPRRPAVPGHIHKIKIDRTKKTYGEIFILSCTQE